MKRILKKESKVVNAIAETNISVGEEISLALYKKLKEVIKPSILETLVGTASKFNVGDIVRLHYKPTEWYQVVFIDHKHLRYGLILVDNSGKARNDSSAQIYWYDKNFEYYHQTPIDYDEFAGYITLVASESEIKNVHSGEKFWYVDSMMRIRPEIIGTKHHTDKFNCHNCFSTYEDAENARDLFIEFAKNV